jgi:hypothetical protein
LAGRAPKYAINGPIADSGSYSDFCAGQPFG